MEFEFNILFKSRVSENKVKMRCYGLIVGVQVGNTSLSLIKSET